MPVNRLTSVQGSAGSELHKQEGLQKGDIFRAEVVESKEGQAVLRIGGMLKRVISTVPLKAGEIALFRVKDFQNSLLVLQKHGDIPTGLEEKSLSGLLRELGLPVSVAGQKVIAHLLSKGLPLSKELIEYIIKGQSSLPGNLRESFIKIAAWLYGTGMRDPQSHQNVMRTLLYSNEILSFIGLLLKGAIEREPEEVKKQWADLVMAQRDINQSKQDSPHLPDILFYPLPLSWNEQRVPAQLYIIMKNKQQMAAEETLSLILSLQGENMGMLWFEIKIQGKVLNITAYAQDQDVADHLAGSRVLLKDALAQIGFQINSFSCLVKSIPSVFELADELGRSERYRSLDIKV
ncbi:MAG: flagellar hook-length control protein FliK [Bacillota bacterium]|jgi:hypothetical protein|nr:flagellar hook-length control protein FliK [Clostridia bacterium]